jgi:hypothetical protein
MSGTNSPANLHGPTTHVKGKMFIRHSICSKPRRQLRRLP